MARPTHPSNLELQALSVLWHAGPSTVATIQETLPDRKERAYTTVLSVMQSLERKNLVKRARVGRADVYQAAYAQEVIVQRATHDFLTNAFGGRLAEALLAILSAGTLTPEEKTNIERELQRHQTMAAKKTAKKAAVKAAKKAAKKVASKAPAKKAPAKKAAKKAPAKKAPAKKTAKKAPAKQGAKKAVKKTAKSAKKAPAKKAAKKTVAKKAPAKKTTKKAVARKAAPVTKAAPVKQAVAAKKPAAKKAAKKASAKKAARK